MKAERERVQDKMRRLTRAYLDQQVDDEDDYERRKLRHELELETLVVPQADTVAEAGRSRMVQGWVMADS